MNENGIVFIDKESGYTSRDVDNILKKKFQTKKVGHLGTLDPFATGVLIVALGKGTKLLQFMEDTDKTYLATLKLGSLTTTLDRTGDVVEVLGVPKLSKELIEKTFNTFLGLQKQVPPIYSAIKVNGRPLYEYARKGKEVEIKEREVYIHYLKLISFKTNEIVFETKVSKGTYIRTLGLDIAKKLGTVGFLDELRRLSVGSYDVFTCKKIAEIDNSDIVGNKEIKIGLPELIVDDQIEKDIIDGKIVILNSKDKEILIRNKRNEMVAVVIKEPNDGYISKRGLF